MKKKRTKEGFHNQENETHTQREIAWCEYKYIYIVQTCVVLLKTITFHLKNDNISHQIRWWVGDCHNDTNVIPPQTKSLYSLSS
jgi:hypothetical protein